jgi:hypothetical protein
MEYAIPNRWQYSVCMAVLDQFKGGESVNKGVSKGKTKKPCFSARLQSMRGTSGRIGINSLWAINTCCASAFISCNSCN